MRKVISRLTIQLLPQASKRLRCRTLFTITLLLGTITLFIAIVSLQTLQLTSFKFISEDRLRDDMKGAAPCIDRHAALYDRVEDIFCQNLPPFEPQYKNPCFYEYQNSSADPVLRCLPYFYIIGMDKCGTTDLHSKIASHRDVRNNIGSLGKETMFWSWKRYGLFNKRLGSYKSTLDDYFYMFYEISEETQQNNGTSHNIITGDATPMDLWDFRSWDWIPQNFKKAEPEILTPHLVRYLYKDRTPKFLIQLRDPIERLYSDYIFLDQGINAATFHAHVLKAIRLLQECVKTKSLRLCFFDRELYNKLPTRIHLGCYSVYIKEWFAVFPRSAFHFTRTEDFHSNARETLTDIYSFLDLEPLPESNLSAIVNQSRKHVTKAKKGKVFSKTFSILHQFYLPCLQETAALLNDDRYLWDDVYRKTRPELVKNVNYDTSRTVTDRLPFMINFTEFDISLFSGTGRRNI